MFAARNQMIAVGLAPPTITGISPSSLLNGGGSVTITGTNFVAGSTTVTVGSVAATGVTVSGTTSLTATFPDQARGSYTVTVTTPAGSGTIPFTYRRTPQLNSITPSDANSGVSTLFTASGSRFQSSGVTSVFNETTQASYTPNITGAGTLTFTATLSTVGTNSIRLLAPDGNSNTANIVVYQPAPTITAISTSRGNGTVIPGTVVTLTGTNLAHGTTTVSVVQTGTTITPTSVSQTQIVFNFPDLGSVTEAGYTVRVATTGSNNKFADIATGTYYRARSAELTTLTSGSGNYTPPAWANFLDVVVMGGGGSGGGSNFFVWGGGGNAGSYNSTTINLISAGWGSRSYSVGAGGATITTWEAGSSGNPGGTTSAAGISAAGGGGGCNACNGPAGTTTAALVLNGVTYPSAVGGGFGNSATANANPGSGGGGGGSNAGPYAGIAGRSGAVYFRAYQ